MLAVLSGSYNGELMACHLQDGHIKWQYSLHGKTRCQAVIDPSRRRIYIGDQKGYAYCIHSQVSPHTQIKFHYLLILEILFVNLFPGTTILFQKIIIFLQTYFMQQLARSDNFSIFQQQKYGKKFEWFCLSTFVVLFSSKIESLTIIIFSVFIPTLYEGTAVLRWDTELPGWPSSWSLDYWYCTVNHTKVRLILVHSFYRLGPCCGALLQHQALSEQPWG